MNPVEDNTAVIAEIRSLAEAVCTGSVTPEQCGRLNTLLLDENAALTYAVYIRMHGLLCWHWQDQVVIIETPETPPPVQLPAGFLGGAWQGTVSYFSQIGPLSYLLAVAITGAMLLGFWAIKVTHYQHIAEAPAQSAPSEAMPEMVFVGRITGMVDVKWSDDPRFLPPLSSRAYVPLGRKYILDSGLLEITYDSGAKVILEGPCTYEVESENGGYLALGKLTARVEKKRSEVRSQRSDHSPLSPLPSPLFSVRTPTALITDLGTEFGVEVDHSGATQSHVFQGKVEVRLTDGGGEARAIQLGANESARVEPGTDRIVVVHRAAVQPNTFARKMPKRVPIKLFNTGVGLKEGDEDTHWQLVARSDDPHFQPRPAVVASVGEGVLPNDPARSQWLSIASDLPPLPIDVVYTFRTTFDLAGTLPETAVFQGKLLADDHIDAIRLNGRSLDMPEFGGLVTVLYWEKFKAAGGFVKGTNVLEIEVFNGYPFGPIGHSSKPNPMSFRVELEGFVFSAATTTSDDTPPASNGKEGASMD